MNVRSTGIVRSGLSVLALAVALSLPAAAQIAWPSTPDPSRPVAVVNGKTISTEQLTVEIERLYPTNSAHGGIIPAKLKEIREKALNELIVEELAFQQAVKSGSLAPAAAVELEYARIRRGAGAAEFDRSLRESGTTPSAFRKELQRRMTLEQQLKTKIFNPAKMTTAALKAYYDQNLSKFKRPESLKARLILAAVNAKDGAEGERKAKDKIDKVYQELLAGKNFAALAEQYSDDYYRVVGGDLGWVHRGRLEPEFEKVAFALKPGTYSQPFRTPYGYNLMLVEARQPEHQMSFREVLPQLRLELEQKRQGELREAWLEQLKKGARIEIPGDSNGAPGGR